MNYSELCETYEDLRKNPSRLKKTEILSNFLKKLKRQKDKQVIYLLQGKAFPDYDEREFGISEQLCIKALEKSSGISKKEIISKWRKIGDLGKISEEIMSKKTQGTLFSHKLTVRKVLDNLQKLPTLEGKGTVSKKLALISELLTSASEAKKLAKLPRKEPKTVMKRLSGKLIYELSIPGVKDVEDVLINQLESSIEIKAIAKDKVYSKTISITLPIKRYTLIKGNLILEFQAK